MSKEVSVGDLTEILKEDDKKEIEKDEELEVEEPGTEKEGEEEDGDIGEGQEKEEKEKLLTIPQFKEVTKKYPKLFEDFPNLRHAFFHAKEYRELFPTVEEAREAADDLEGLREMETALTSGKPEDVVGILTSIKGLGDEAVPNLAINFLSSIKKMDQDLYYKVITPELVNFTRIMFDAGLRNENDNLKNAALVAALHFFGDQKVASGEKEIKLPTSKKEGSVENEKLERERTSFRNERYSTFYNDVVQSADSQLSKAILNGLDPKEEMTEGIKELISEKVMKEMTMTLAKDPSHTSRMDSLWRKAAKDNFSGNWKSKIISAYLEAAKEIMPRVRAKVRAGILGIRERHSETSGGERKEKRIEPNSTTGGGRRSSSDTKNLDAKKIDWRKTSDLDLIRGNVTLKS